MADFLAYDGQTNIEIRTRRVGVRGRTFTFSRKILQVNSITNARIFLFTQTSSSCQTHSYSRKTPSSKMPLTPQHPKTRTIQSSIHPSIHPSRYAPGSLRKDRIGGTAGRVHFIKINIHVFKSPISHTHAQFSYFHFLFLFRNHIANL